MITSGEKGEGESEVGEWEGQTMEGVRQTQGCIVQPWGIQPIFFNNYKWKVIFKLYKRYLYIIVNNHMLMVLSVPTSNLVHFQLNQSQSYANIICTDLQFESFCHINPSAVLPPFCVSVLHNRDTIFFLKTSIGGPKRENLLTFI